MVTRDLTHPKGPTIEVIEGNLVKALAHPVRAHALAILNERVASPKELELVLNRPVSNISYHCRKLVELGCAEIVNEEPRRGATEHFYRGVTRSFLNDENWAKLSPEARKGVSIAGLRMQSDAVNESLDAGLFDSRADRHLSCTPVNLDEDGWREMTDLLAGTLEEVIEIQARSVDRQVAASDEKTMRATVSILSFESPVSEPVREAA